MKEIMANVAMIAIFIVIGGVFSAAEMALVSLRESQVKQLATRGKRGQTVARLAADPNRFLSAVQVGVTLMGFLSAAFGGETLKGHLAPVFESLGLSSRLSNPLALIAITVVIAYFSIVLGELVSKRLAMQRSESFALILGPIVDAIARILRPVIWFLGISTDLVVRLLGGDPDASREDVTDEELRAMVAGSSSLGEEERRIVDDVFDAGERSLREVMVPRTEVDFLSGDMPAYKAFREVQGAPHSRYPVTNGSTDEIAGFLHVRDLMDLDTVSRQTPVVQLVRPVVSFPDTVKVLHALTRMRAEHIHLAIVRDEYGGTAGIVTLEDLVEELIGDITDEYDVVEEDHLDDDLDGLLSLEDFAERTGLLLPEGPYDTLAGYVMAQLGKVPEAGDQLIAELLPVSGEDEQIAVAVDMTITELDGRRAARVRVRRH
ncbi:MAG: hemolysin family protein [Propionibacteriaceae bacterium]